jgi:hypothetical protein
VRRMAIVLCFCYTGFCKDGKLCKMCRLYVAIMAESSMKSFSSYYCPARVKRVYTFILRYVLLLIGYCEIILGF